MRGTGEEGDGGWVGGAGYRAVWRGRGRYGRLEDGRGMGMVCKGRCDAVKGEEGRGRTKWMGKVRNGRKNLKKGLEG